MTGQRWTVTTEGEAATLTVDEDGITIAGAADTTHLPWSGISRVEVLRTGVRIVHADGGPATVVGLPAHEDLTEVRAALDGAGSGRTTVMDYSRGSLPASPPPALDSAAQARQDLKSCFWCGALAQVVGAVIAVAASRRAVGVVPADAGGPLVGVLVGWAVAWAGALVTLVAVVGWGVMLGRRASR